MSLHDIITDFQFKNTILASPSRDEERRRNETAYYSLCNLILDLKERVQELENEKSDNEKATE